MEAKTRNTRIFAIVAAVVVAIAAIAGGIWASNEAAVASEYNQEVERTYLDRVTGLPDPVDFEAEGVEHDAVLTNLMETNEWLDSFTDEGIIYYDGSDYLYQQGLKAANDQIDADVAWLQTYYTDTRDANIADPAELGSNAVTSMKNALASLTATIDADYEKCPAIWDSEQAKDDFIASYQDAIAACNDRIAAIEAEEQAKAEEAAASGSGGYTDSNGNWVAISSNSYSGGNSSGSNSKWGQDFVDANGELWEWGGYGWSANSYKPGGSNYDPTCGGILDENGNVKGL